MGTKTRFEEKAKGNSEMAYYVCSLWPETFLELNDAAHNYLVQRYGVFDHAPQTVDDGRESDSTRCITIAVHLGPSSRKIEHCTALQRKVILNLLETTLSYRIQTSAPKSDDKTMNVNFFPTKTEFSKFIIPIPSPSS